MRISFVRKDLATVISQQWKSHSVTKSNMIQYQSLQEFFLKERQSYDWPFCIIQNSHTDMTRSFILKHIGQRARVAMELRLSCTNPSKSLQSTDERSPNEFQWLDLKITHQDSGPSNGRQGDMPYYIDGLVQERHNSSALAMELCLSCTNPSICLCSISLNWSQDLYTQTIPQTDYTGEEHLWGRAR